MKKGFVLVETIAVITVLCIILVLLYASYSNLIKSVEEKSLYDNTEYIYKTAIVRDYILEHKDGPLSLTDSIIYCRNNSSNECYNETCATDNCNFFRFLKVQAVYITPWETSGITGAISHIEATTQKYIRYIDAKNMPTYNNRIIVMYIDENNDKPIKDGKRIEESYQYASLKIEVE